MNYFVVKTKNEDVLLKTDYKKIKGAEVKKHLDILLNLLYKNQSK